ncbi:MAG TPA: hypothetical protein VGE52_01590 [Pirellulales bacterium]
MRKKTGKTLQRNTGEFGVKNMTLTIPVFVVEQLEKFPRINRSQVATRAFMIEVAEEMLSNIDPPARRLLDLVKAQKQKLESAFDIEACRRVGRDEGFTWACQQATDQELERFCRPPAEVFTSGEPLRDFASLFQSELPPGDLALVLRYIVGDSLTSALLLDGEYIRAFYDGVHNVSRRLKSKDESGVVGALMRAKAK